MFQIELLKDYFVIFVKNQNKSSFSKNIVVFTIHNFSELRFYAVTLPFIVSFEKNTQNILIFLIKNLIID